MKLTSNFYLEEFTTSAGLVIKPTNEQIFCIKVLCENILQPIRDKFGHTKITSGLRNIESAKKLEKQGYKVSWTSDHFAWSIANPRGTGASDIICTEADSMMDVFLWIQRYLYDMLGQVIYYKNDNFIHISNRFSNIFRMNDTMEEHRRVMINENNKFQPYPRLKPIRQKKK